MRRRSAICRVALTLALALGLCLAAPAGCGDDGGGDSGGSGGGVLGYGGGGGGSFACDSDPGCGAGSPDAYTEDAAILAKAVDDLLAIGCSRFFYDDCAYLCDSIWYTCAPTFEQCVENERADRLEDFDYPVLNPALAYQCGVEMVDAPCDDLPPDSFACDYALIEGCPGDDDALGGPYTHVAAFPLTTFPVQLEQTLCDNVEEHLTLELLQGDIVRLGGVSQEPSNGFLWVALSVEDPTDDEPFHLNSKSMPWSGESNEDFDPVTLSIKYTVDVVRE